MPVGRPANGNRLWTRRIRGRGDFTTQIHFIGKRGDARQIDRGVALGPIVLPGVKRQAQMRLRARGRDEEQALFLARVGVLVAVSAFRALDHPLWLWTSLS